MEAVLLAETVRLVDSDAYLDMPFDNRLCPDENLLRQNCFHLATKGPKSIGLLA